MDLKRIRFELDQNPSYLEKYGFKGGVEEFNRFNTRIELLNKIENINFIDYDENSENYNAFSATFKTFLLYSTLEDYAILIYSSEVKEKMKKIRLIVYELLNNQKAKDLIQELDDIMFDEEIIEYIKYSINFNYKTRLLKTNPKELNTLNKQSIFEYVYSIRNSFAHGVNIENIWGSNPHYVSMFCNKIFEFLKIEFNNHFKNKFNEKV